MFPLMVGNIVLEGNVPAGDKRPAGAGHRIAAGDEARRAEEPAVGTRKRFAPWSGATARFNATSCTPMTSPIVAPLRGAGKFGNPHPQFLAPLRGDFAPPALGRR